ncbi:putative AlkP superfamily phosphohydrolase/phosphomutase [Desulfobaculum xiamenense]|uniref:Putative AlkP superfamily phosphohydrolase/phosphomutase n=1 Tax=Desulfobaculum xiamenense TaxID=995050 RepID=A0A846QP56_9BACT|nr:alkaline phosphatase family protein [Desulfobaculum xiamenense]NJB66489.1 putative AlkP superfamily phosphohydrolase/phosphomutase [Desulfobaculum xiamenense]
MARVAKRAALLGFDCMIPKRLQALVDEGALPNFQKFIEGGSYMTEGFNMPTVTPPSWASICTGAYPRTHGVEDYYYYLEGSSLEHHKTCQAFGSEPLTAQTIWDAWDKQGKQCLVVNYPMSWPSHMKNGVMVQGQGLSPAESRWKELGNGHKEWLASEGVIATDFYPMGEQVRFDDAKGWKNLPENAEEPLEFAVRMHFKESMDPLEDQVWYGLTWESEDDGYDIFALCPEKDFEKAFFVLRQGEWSDVVKHDFVIKSDGRTEPGTFRAKLLQLSDDAEDFTLYVTGISGRHGFIAPADGVKGVDWDQHIICNDMGFVAFVHGIIDMQTVVEVAEFHSQWVTELCLKTMESNPNWDLFYMHTHLIDWFYHGWLSEMESTDPEVAKKALDMERAIYQIEDRFLGRMMEAMDDGETLVCCVSDHGATRLGPILNTAEALKAKGLTSYEPKKTENYWEIYEESEGFNYELDVTKSKAVPQRYMFVYVNLASKYPGGIVADEDYEKVRGEIIDALYDYKHPETGERPVLLAVRKEDAAVFGMGGAQAGDVVYVLKPEYMAEHGYGLPTGECGLGTLKNCMFFKGPGIRKNYRYERPRWLVDVVPTFCYATGNPVPADVEGAPIYQIFENPNLVD